jgi:hypothetical protein
MHEVCYDIDRMSTTDIVLSTQGSRRLPIERAEAASELDAHQVVVARFA